MKIKLSPTISFWGLMDPIDLKLTLSLSESSPLAEIDESKLYDWELKQIIGSVKDRRISISVKVEDLLKSLEEKTIIKQEKKAIKKVLKLKA
jgi:hypothetical protein